LQSPPVDLFTKLIGVLPYAVTGKAVLTARALV
jgi:hypothetical protein